MAQVCTRFDAAAYLGGIVGAAAYLPIAPAESRQDLAAVLRALGVIARSGNMSEQRWVGVSRDGLCEALSEQGNPTWSTVLRVSEALGRCLFFEAVACHASVVSTAC